MCVWSGREAEGLQGKTVDAKLIHRMLMAALRPVAEAVHSVYYGAYQLQAGY